MLQVKNVAKRFANGKKALENISFSLDSGEMLFLTGHSGAGKSTLLKIIAIIERINSGRVIFNNQEIGKLNNQQIPLFRRQLGLIFQDPLLLPERSVFNNVAFPLVIAGVSYREIRGKVRAALDKVGLLRREKAYPSDLSSGEQQRVSIARAIVHKPPLLLADEPTGNLDPSLSKDIMRVFQQLNSVGVSALIASHDIELIAQFPYHKLTLQQGRLVNGH